MKKFIVAVDDRDARPRPSRRAGLAALVMGLALFLPACAGGTAGSAPEPETSTVRAEAETTGTPVAAETTAATGVGAGAGAGQTTAAAGASAEQATARYLVPTITCPSCVARVEANAKKDPGVLDAKASLETQEVTVTYDPAKTDPRKIAEAIRAGGDTVQPL